MKVILKEARLAFPNLWKAEPFSAGGDKEYFNASFIIPAGGVDEDAMMEAMLAVAEDKWPGKGQEMRDELIRRERCCLGDGDNKSKYAGFAGNMFVSSRSENRPSVRDRRGRPTVKEDGLLYAGAYVRGIVDVWAQSSQQWGKRINASLMGVQFVRDGEAFSGGGAAGDDDFEDLGEDGIEENYLENDPLAG